ncbi:MAG TPA: cbb3-type cytochrome oxidase assembly protein CcoS [Rhodocyclaceae bacterium]|nr:cbb3-type cytochrome oxidase assembly protein CcoS [Rhodocyclaceae bacterium]HNH35625.1 cbb3-type cytochrome oxidase assembly protein CcoS [Rhodocyclaceae bacterium]
MDILYLLIPMSVVLVFAIAALFWWSLRHGQFEDLEGPAYRILMDDDGPNKPDSADRPASADPGPTTRK